MAAGKTSAIKAVSSRALDRAEPLIRGVIYISGWSSILFVAAIFFFIFKEAAPILTKVDWGEFLFENRWIPNPAEGNKAHYGAAGILYGTFAITVVSTMIAMPLGFAAAVYISEFATGKVKETLKVLIELLAAIPSIIWGFIGLVIMGPIIQKFFNVEVGVNLLNASLMVAFMAIPLIVSISEDALRAVPDSYREAAVALGASKWEVVYKLQTRQMGPQDLKPSFLTPNGRSKPTVAQQHPDQAREILPTELQIPIWFSTPKALI
ncbi:ABC transporter permease subunit [bacterium]|nr:ABC transporter permease subunit [bacterium]